MSTSALQAFNASGWKQAYIAALFETDKRKINTLSVAAEMAIVLRARELFGTEGDHSRETAALEAALLGLHSLRGVTAANNSPVRRVMAGMIWQPDAATSEANRRRAMAQDGSKVVKDWRNLAEEASKETDPIKLDRLSD